jgi:hypothetical protein
VTIRDCSRVHAGNGQSTVVRILQEGEDSLLGAAESAGLRRLPNVFVMMRAARKGQLEAFKSQGRWRTSAAAVIRWLERQQLRPDQAAVPTAEVDR